MTTEYIIDSAGRRGIVTRSPYHPGGFFARPVEFAAVVRSGGVAFTMDTFFRDAGNGTFIGRWADSPMGAQPIIATLEG